MPGPIKFRCFNIDLGSAVHKLGTDTLKVMLSNVEPKQTAKVKADIAEIAAGNGYPEGGLPVKNTAYEDRNGIAVLTGDDVLFAAAVGEMAEFRFSVVYNASRPGGPLISWADRGASTVLQPGDEFVARFNQREVLTVS